MLPFGAAFLEIDDKGFTPKAGILLATDIATLAIPVAGKAAGVIGRGAARKIVATAVRAQYLAAGAQAGLATRDILHEGFTWENSGQLLDALLILAGARYDAKALRSDAETLLSKVSAPDALRYRRKGMVRFGRRIDSGSKPHPKPDTGDIEPGTTDALFGTESRPRTLEAGEDLGENAGTLAPATHPGAAPRGNVDPPYDPRSIRDTLEERYPGRVTSSTTPPSNARNVGVPNTRSPADIPYNSRGLPVFDAVPGAVKVDLGIPRSVSSVENHGLHLREATRQLRELIESGQIPRSQFTENQWRAIKGGRAKIPGYTWHHHEDIG
ncbi:MAG: HNH endonuclease [Planctomycetes bacterium]|nr:HNH endonuclease [Planctomycetota bacterium]